MPLLGAASGTAAQAIAWLAPRAAGYTLFDITSIVGAYQSFGDVVAMDWFLAIAQLVHETGSLTSWWSQRPRRNPAGIGVTGRETTSAPPSLAGWHWTGRRWLEGVAFASWQASAQAHIGRLLAYALPIAHATSVQRQLIHGALSLRPLPPAYLGAAPTLDGLAGRWALSQEYPDKIAAIARAITMS